MSTKDEAAFQFISVEIGITSTSECPAFAQWCEATFPHGTPQTEDKHFHIYGVPVYSAGDPNATIQQLCDKLEAAPAEVRRDWQNAIRREFAIGWEFSKPPTRGVWLWLDEKTIALAAKHCASIAHVTYHNPND